MTALTTRFAPSPTGNLHLGHAFSALSAYEAARWHGGRFILRVEDIDHTRCRPEFEAAIFEDLAWLGLEWETPVFRQSEHLADYQTALEGLITRGLAYRCFRTRSQMNTASAPHGPASSFVGARLDLDEEVQRLAAGHPFAWRLSLDAARDALGGFEGLAFQEQAKGQPGLIAAQPELLGDIVLARKDLGVAYHLAVTVDDARQGITHIVRGEDLFEATHIQRLLQALLDLPTPVYRHHRLILGPDGKRLAKRNKAQTLASLRERGVTPVEVRRELGFE